MVLVRTLKSRCTSLTFEWLIGNLTIADLFSPLRLCSSQAQLVVLSTQIAWSENIESALTTVSGGGDMSPMQGVLSNVEATLNVLADTVLMEQPALRRRKLEHLVRDKKTYSCLFIITVEAFGFPEALQLQLKKPFYLFTLFKIIQNSAFLLWKKWNKLFRANWNRLFQWSSLSNFDSLLYVPLC